MAQAWTCWPPYITEGSPAQGETGEVAEVSDVPGNTLNLTTGYQMASVEPGSRACMGSLSPGESPCGWRHSWIPQFQGKQTPPLSP